MLLQLRVPDLVRREPPSRYVPADKSDPQVPLRKASPTRSFDSVRHRLSTHYFIMNGTGVPGRTLDTDNVRKAGRPRAQTFGVQIR